MKILGIFSIICVMFLADCGKKNEKIYSVDSGMADYLQRFVLEGQSRGVTVNSSNLIMEFVDQVILNGTEFCGQAIPGNNPPHVQVVRNDGCWNSENDIVREILIFHELGHALLGRVHDNSTLSNGLQKTIMISKSPFGLYSKFTPELRKYYIDELFNPNAPEPSWAKIKANSTQLLKDSITVKTDWQYDNAFSDLKHLGSVSGIYFSPYHSLSISAPNATGTTNESSYWYKVIMPVNIAVGTELRLKVKVKTDNVIGGAVISIKGFSGTEPVFFTTSQNQYDLKGTQNFTEYFIEVLYYPQSVDSLYILLQLIGGAPGTVYFDDVELLNEY